MYKYVDLFAGCGGLSLGLEKAGFELELAVEKSDMAAETYYHNFIQKIDSEGWKKFCSLPIEKQAEKKLVVDELSNVLKNGKIINSLKEKNIDLIAGGPPCQGFSMAGRRDPKDNRNMLPWQFLELVEKVEPKAVILENVAGMRQNFVKHNQEAPFEKISKVLAKTGKGYFVQQVLLNAMHFGVPQHRPRVMILAIRKDLNIKDLKITKEIWKSDYDKPTDIKILERPTLAPQANYFGKDIKTVMFALKGLNSKSKNHNFRKHSDLISERFRLYQYFRDNNIPFKILNLAAKSEETNSVKKLQLFDYLEDAKFPAVSPDGKVIAQDKDELVDLIISLATKKHSQRALYADKPSPTVVSLPDDYVHPFEPRTLTVREMARFQSFPDNFEFKSKETTGSSRRRFEVPQYTQVGNAVPPLLAEAVGKKLVEVLDMSLNVDFEVKTTKISASSN